MLIIIIHCLAWFPFYLAYLLVYSHACIFGLQNLKGEVSSLQLQLRMAVQQLEDDSSDGSSLTQYKQFYASVETPMMRLQKWLYIFLTCMLFSLLCGNHYTACILSDMHIIIHYLVNSLYTHSIIISLTLKMSNIPSKYHVQAEPFVYSSASLVKCGIHTYYHHYYV